MATYATLTIPVADIIGANFNESRASVWIEPNTPVVLADSIRVGGRREQVINGVATFANLVTTNSADNPTSFGYRVTITAPPKGAAKREDIVTLTTSDFPFTATGSLKDISAAWDNIAIPPNWQSDFRTEMTALRDDAAAIVGLPTEAAAQAYNINNDATVQSALSARIAGSPDVTKRVEVREAPLSPYRYGFVGDGTTDDTAALQATLNAAPNGALIDLPHSGNAKITAPLSITKPVTIQGRSLYSQRIFAVGCNAIEVASGVDDVRIIGLELAASVRHSTTANTYVGLKVDGTTGDRPTNHVYRDLYIDGFSTGIQTRYLWSSNIENVRTGFGKIGLHAYGKSVNNFVHGCQFSVTAQAGSKGIALFGRESASDSTEVATEGWIISDTLTNGAEVGIDMISCNHVSIHDCILDFNMKYAIRAQSGPTVFSTNYTIHDNYIAMTGASGSAAILLANSIDDAQRRWSRVHHNEILAYGGSTCPYGISASGTFAQSVIEGNTFRNFSTTDILASAVGSVIRGNVCLSTASPNIHAANGALVGDNVGAVFRTGDTATANYRRDANGKRVVAGPAAPTTGAWLQGERVINDAPVVGSSKGWVCTVAGSPGTWVSEGNL